MIVGYILERKNMVLGKTIPSLLLITFFAVPVAAQTTNTQRSDFFVAPVAEVLGSRRSPGFGGGIAIGAGGSPAIGARMLYVIDFESFHSLEIAVFMRFYPLAPETCSGLFVQLNTGAVIFAYDKAVSVPAEIGAVSASLAAGWRFLLGEHWYVEPAVRTGYPYLIGCGVSAGFRL